LVIVLAKRLAVSVGFGGGVMVMRDPCFSPKLDSVRESSLTAEVPTWIIDLSSWDRGDMICDKVVVSSDPEGT
jgi:hypothetical protein